MSSWVSAILPHRTSDNRAARAGVEEPDTALVARHVGVNQSVTAFLIARSCAQMRREVSADFPATRRYLSQRTLIRRKTEPGRLGTRYADTPTRWPKQLRTRTEGTTDDVETPHLLDRGALHARDPCTGPDNVDELDHSYQRHARKRSRYRWWCQRELFWRVDRVRHQRQQHDLVAQQLLHRRHGDRVAECYRRRSTARRRYGYQYD